MPIIQKLLILDIDETLIHATKVPANDEWSFNCGPYSVYIRPGLKLFLKEVMKHYRIALWTTGSATYADCIAGQIFKGFKAPLFIWSREKCIIRQDEETGKLAYLKDLKKIKGFKIPLENVLIVEDTPQAVQRHMGNLIKISKYYGLSEDAELIALAKYLISIKDVANFRELDKRGWRSSVTP